MTVQEHVLIPARRAEVWEVLTGGPGAARWLGADPTESLGSGSEVRLRHRPGVIGKVETFDPDATTLSIRFNDDIAEITFTDYQPQSGDGELQTRIEVTEPAHPSVARAWKVALGAAFLACWGAIGARDPRQAVIFVHGIGEQFPGSTSQSMADAVFGADNYYSKPDRASGSYELRRLQVDKDEAGNLPRTDVFELYWGDKIRDTTLGQVTRWLLRLLRRRRRNVSKGLRPLWWLTRILALVAVAAVVFLVLTLGLDGVGALWDNVSTIAQLWWVSAILGLVLSVITGWLVYNLGDAARYLSSHPDNIKARTEIRDTGINLLRRLHKDPRYHRIIVAGHSLGSVVAYDALLHYWSQVNTEHRHLDDPDDGPVEDYEQAAPGAVANRHHVLQHKLCKGMRGNGVPWLVTDFVTFGSPLAHAGTLIADSPDHLESLKDHRVLAACPPQPDKAATTHPYSYRRRYLSNQGTPSIRVLHHAALFGPTRWTNLYAPVTLGILGDVIGGPVAPAFGAGVKDVEVHYRKWLTRFTILAHTSYWTDDPKAPAGENPAIVFREALRVTSLKDLSDLAATLPLSWFLRPDDGLLPETRTD